MSDILNELRHNTMILTKAIDHRTDSLEQELEWSNALLSKARQLLYNSRIITANLEKLLKAIQELTNMAMHLISHDVRQIHKQTRIHYVHVENHIIISLLIPLKANKNPFSYYKIVKKEVTIPNSQVSMILDNKGNYIAIETNSRQFTYLTDMEVQSIQVDKDYLVPKKLIYNNNGNIYCLTANLQE